MTVAVLLVSLGLAAALGVRLLGTPRGERLLVGCVLGWASLFTVHGILGFYQVSREVPAVVDNMRPPTPLVVQRLDGGAPIQIPRGYLWPRYAEPAYAARLALGLLGALGLLLLLRRRSLAKRELDGARWVDLAAPGRRWQLWLLAAAAVVLAIGAVSAFGPPRGYDALWYHLPMATFFARSDSLAPFSDEATAFFPGNGALWLSLGIRLGFDRALNLMQLPFALLLGLGVARLAAATGLRRGRLFVAASVLGAPVVLFQSTTAYVDLVAAAPLLAAAVLLTRFAREGRAVHVALAGLAAGIAVGAKYAALPPTLVLLLVTLLAGLELFRSPLQRRRRPLGLRLLRAAAAGLLFILALLPPSSFWYWRNARLTGNPVFPVTLRLAGRELVAGIAPPEAFNQGKEREFVAAPWRWLDQPFRERYSVESGLGAPLAVLALPALLAALLLALQSVRRRGRLPLLALPLLLSLGSLLVWARGSREPRHLLPAALFLAPLLGLFLRGDRLAERLRPWLVAGLLGTLLIALRTALFSTSHELGPVVGKSRLTYYALPAAYEELPPGSVIENRAGRPYNDPAQGKRRDYRVRPQVGGDPPSREALRYHGVRYVLHRGLPGAERTPGTLLFRQPLEGHPWWDVKPGQVLELYRLEGD